MIKKTSLQSLLNPSQLRYAAEIAKENRLQNIQVRKGSNGTEHLSAKSLDSFHFVDHPHLSFTPDREIVSRFSCDCPEGRRGNFCIHCAALLHSQRPLMAFGRMPQVEIVESGQEIRDLNRSVSNPQHSDFSLPIRNAADEIYRGCKKEQIRIPLDRYYQILGHNAFAEAKYENQGEWSGRAFGLAAVSALLNDPGSGVSLSDFAPSAQSLSELSLHRWNRRLGKDLLTLVEEMEVAQEHPLVQKQLMEQLEERRKATDTAACDRQRFEQISAWTRSLRSAYNGGAILCTWGRKGGNALLPYEEDVQADGRKYLRVYDGNSPKPWQAGTFLMDPTRGGSTVLAYSVGGECRWSENSPDGEWAYCDYEHFGTVWKQRPMPLGTENGCLFTDCSVTVLDQNRNELLKISEGHAELLTRKGTICRQAGKISNTKLSIYLPPEPYFLRSDDPGQKMMAFTFAVGDRSVKVITTAREVRFQASDVEKLCFAEISEGYALYDVHIRSTDPEDEIPVLSVSGTVREKPLTVGIAKHQVQIQNHAYGPVWYDGPVKLENNLTGSTVNAENAALRYEKEIYRYSFRFANAREDLYPQVRWNETPCLSRKSFYEILGAERQVAKAFYARFKEWGGTCYGFAALGSIFNWKPFGIRVGDFRTGAELPWELELENSHQGIQLNVHELIDQLFLTQLHPYVYHNRHETEVEGLDTFMTALCKEIQAYCRGEKALCCLGVGKKMGKKRAGHELLPYRVDEIGERESRIALYDCNYPGEERYLYLYRGEDGRVRNWKYDMGGLGVWSWDEGDCDMSYTEQERIFEVWEKRPMPYDYEKGTFLSNSSLYLENANGEETLRISSEGYRTQNKDTRIFWMNGVSSDAPPIVSMPEGRYTVRSLQNEKNMTELSFTAKHRGVSVRTDALEYYFRVDGHEELCGVRILEENREYSIRLDCSHGENQMDVQLDGVTGPEGVTLTMINRELFAEGVSEQTRQSLKVNGEEMPVESLIRKKEPEQNRQDERILNCVPDPDQDQTKH